MNLNEFPLWTALITPFDNEGQIDFASLDKLLTEQNDARNGILLLGSTGEALNMSHSMRVAILEHALKRNYNVPLMVGVGGSDFIETKKWVEYLNSLPIHAVLLVTPLYAKPGPIGQYEWFKGLMDSTKHQVMLYNVPSRTGVAMSTEAVRRLANHPQMWAIKEASGSTDRFREFRDVFSGNIMSGDDGLLPEFCKIGCQGLVSVASNAWPKATKKYVEKSIEKTLSSEEASLWDACAGALFCASNPIPVKRLLAEENRIATPVLLPPLTHKDLGQAVTVLEASKRIDDWYQKNQ